MGQDISKILEGWDFQPHELNVRVIVGDDGQEKIQMRIDLGLLQMMMNGRPDGERPFGFDSLLEYHEAESQRLKQNYRLSADAIDDLFREAWQYYHRYLCLFHVANYPLVVRDTERNLRLFSFVRRHAKKRREQWKFDQSRPFVIMMNSRAKAMMALNQGDSNQALAEIDEGLRQIDAFLNEYNRLEQRGEYFEIDFLERWRDDLCEQTKPEETTLDADELSALRNYLRKAVDREDYEFAAMLRDKIKRIRRPDEPPGG